MMYNSNTLQHFTRETQRLLPQAQSTPFCSDEKDIALLRDILHFHEHRYYVLNAPLLADYEYDQLFKWLVATEQQFPEKRTPDSPTLRIGSSLNSQIQTVAHLVPMLSLDNSYQPEDLIDFNRKVLELSSATQVTYCVEPKFDGASISLLYENDRLTRATTRGDGVEGEEITQNIRQIRSIPLQASFSTFGIKQIEIRGEVIMSKQSFDAFNRELSAQGLNVLANPRNAAAGSLRMKDTREVARRKLDAFLYHISYVLLDD